MKKTTIKRAVSCAAAFALLCGALSGCGANGGKDDGKVKISIGHWPTETEEARLKIFDGYLKKMNEKYPDITIEKDEYDYNLETFIVRAASNQLPTLYRTWYTEIDKVIGAGAAKDITSVMEANGFAKAMNPDVLDLVSQDGKIYATPQDGYAQGLFINKNVFKEAGLINSDGSIKIPQTWTEVAEMGKTIREKTGKGGFAMPAKGNIGGWHFMNIAWSYGVDFMSEKDGKYTQTFDSQECIDALQYVKDLKWKYNAIQDNALIDRAAMNELFATNKVGMYIADPPNDDIITYLDMNKDDIVFARMPEGPKGRYTQMGGNVRMIAANATDEQAEAAFKWLEIIGESPVLNEDGMSALEENLKQRTADGLVVFDEVPFKMWVSPERDGQESSLRKKYLNVNPSDYEDYFSFKDVIICPEEPAATQELYTILDSCIQEVLTNENADVAALIKQAATDFQNNHLNKLD